jgi:hypothetical protein
LNYLFLIPMAMITAGLTRAFIHALVHVSSFPAVFHDRMSPANPLVLIASTLLLYLLWSRVRDAYSGSGPLQTCVVRPAR